MSDIDVLFSFTIDIGIEKQINVCEIEIYEDNTIIATDPNKKFSVLPPESIYIIQSRLEDTLAKVKTAIKILEEGNCYNMDDRQLYEKYNGEKAFNQYISKLIEFGMTITFSEFCIIEELWTSGFLKALNNLPKAPVIHFKEPINWKSYNDGYEIGKSVLNQTKNED